MTIYTKDFVKDPLAIEDFTVDWSAWLAGDTILNSTWEVPDGIDKAHDGLYGACAVIWLSGGAVLNDYAIYNTITTEGGRTERALINIRIR